MRLRIAPSPTGSLHIGTARAALYNWLLARRTAGAFILRIEDTDRERSKPEFEKDIIESLKWLGLDWDEGPDIGGPYGPYRQTQRLNTYQTALEQLLANGRAFWCFHTAAALAQERALKAAAKEMQIHHCEHRNLTPAQQVDRLKSGEPGVIRLKVEPGEIIFQDAIRGEIKVAADTLGDFVIAKSLTEPLYNFAVVVDDQLMAITHVLRGEDHISNTPKQILIYDALEYPKPIFGHLPLILAEDRSKLSKRHGATAVAQYREQGYLPQALVNFMAFLGWNPGTDQDVFSIKELIDAFSLERIRKSGSVFNKKRLDWLNGQHLRRLTSQEFFAACQPFLKKAPLCMICQEGKCRTVSGGVWSQKQVEDTLTQEQPRIKTLAEIQPNIAFYFANELDYAATMLTWRKSDQVSAKQALGQILKICATVPAGDWAKPRLEAEFKNILDNAPDRGTILWPWRVALTGQEKSPGPFEVAILLGREQTLTRLERAISKIS